MGTVQKVGRRPRDLHLQATEQSWKEVWICEVLRGFRRPCFGKTVR